MRAHAITTKASTIVSGGILALGLAVVLLAATASTAGAETQLRPWYCPPPATPSITIGQARECVGREHSFGFGDRRVGTTSPVQPFVLVVNGDPPSTPRSASPATTPRPMTVHRRCRCIPRSR